jgi:hypothetical protein
LDLPPKGGEEDATEVTDEVVSEAALKGPVLTTGSGNGWNIVELASIGGVASLALVLFRAVGRATGGAPRVSIGDEEGSFE